MRYSKLGYSEGDEAAKFFSEALGEDLVLCRSAKDELYDPDITKVPFTREGDKTTGFCYYSSFLLYNQASVDDLVRIMNDQYTKRGEADKLSEVNIKKELFRSNFILDLQVPYIEDAWRKLELKTKEGEDLALHFHGHNGRCNALTVDVDKHKRNFDKEPFSTLNLYRRSNRNNKPLFGVLFQVTEPEAGKDRTIYAGSVLKI